MPGEVKTELRQIGFLSLEVEKNGGRCREGKRGGVAHDAQREHRNGRGGACFRDDGRFHIDRHRASAARNRLPLVR